MVEFPIAETFESINGEGTRSGQLAYFIRFPGCNLNCSFCDTSWANKPRNNWNVRSDDQLVHEVKSSGVKLVTLTGGEPLLQPDLPLLIDKLYQIPGLSVEIETNGSQSIARYDHAEPRPVFTLDCKLPGSGMQEAMLYDNYSHLCPEDTVKFVCGSETDLHRAEEIIKRFHLLEHCHVFFSPVFGRIEPADIVSYMITHKLNGVTLQLQIHKFIWDPNAKGV